MQSGVLKIKRKVVLHGPSTLTISLPTKWIKKHGVKKGDELEVEEFDKILKVSTDREYSPVRSIKVDLNNLSEDAIKSILAVLHKSGYDEIEVDFKDANTLKIIQERISSMLIGYEIIEQGNKRCIIKSISSNEEQEFNNVLRRTFLVSLSLANNSLDVIKSGKFDKLDEVLILEQTNNRLTNFCHRILNKKISMNEKTIYYYTIIWILESICDDYKHIINFIKTNNKMKTSSKLVDLYKRTNSLFDSYYNLFYKYTNEGMDRLRMEHKSLSQELVNAINAKDEKGAAFFIYLYNITQRIYDAIGSTTGLYY